MSSLRWHAQHTALRLCGEWNWRTFIPAVFIALAVLYDINVYVLFFFLNVCADSTSKTNNIDSHANTVYALVKRIGKRL